MSFDLVSNALSRLRNANSVKHKETLVPLNNLVLGILKVLLEEGYIKGYDVPLQVGKERGFCKVSLSYRGGKSSISEIKRVSTPGRRIYSSIKELKPFYNGHGTLIISSSIGVISDNYAKEKNVGGEVLCSIF